jgi:hypothetical protein
LVITSIVSGLSATYSNANFQPNLRAAVAHPSQTQAVTRPSGSRLWVISDAGSEPMVAAALAQEGWHVVSTGTFKPGIELALDTR